jgi:hypothetical protein
MAEIMDAGGGLPGYIETFLKARDICCSVRVQPRTGFHVGELFIAVGLYVLWRDHDECCHSELRKSTRSPPLFRQTT